MTDQIQEPAHNHLDSMRRDEGVCPACDLAWERQRERLDKAGRSVKAEREVAAMERKEMKLAEQRYGQPQ